MKYLIVALGLLLAGCAGHQAKHSQITKDFQVAMQKVLDARNDIRQVISRLPRTHAELDGPAHGDPNALLFNVQDFATRLQTIPLPGCPADFKSAFGNYVAAWQARAAMNPNLQLRTNPGTKLPGNNIPAGTGDTEAAWQLVLSVQNSYAAKPPPKDF
jgi:hypothetical protein